MKAALPSSSTIARTDWPWLTDARCDTKWTSRLARSYQFRLDQVGPTPSCFSDFNDTLGVPERFPFIETQSMATVAKYSDGGRYKSSILLVGTVALALPLFLCLLGHHVTVTDLTDEEADAQHLLADLFEVSPLLTIIRQRFLRWSPVSPEFRMVLFPGTLSRIRLDQRRNWTEDAGDSLALSKARAVHNTSGVVQFDVPIVTGANSFGPRLYTIGDAKRRLLDFAEQVCYHGRDPDETTFLHSWIVR